MSFAYPLVFDAKKYCTIIIKRPTMGDVTEEIEKLRNVESFEHLWQKVEVFFPKTILDSLASGDNEKISNAAHDFLPRRAEIS